VNGVEGSGMDADVGAVAVAEDDPIVYVDGKPMPYSQVGEEHHDMMTADEYAAYFEIFQQRSA